MEVSKDNNLKFTHNKRIFYLLYIIFIIMLTSILKNTSASAVTIPGRSSEMPLYIFNPLNRCDDPSINAGVQSPAIGEWISPQGNPRSVTKTVDYGTPSIDLTLHFNGVTCRPTTDFPVPVNYATNSYSLIDDLVSTDGTTVSTMLGLIRNIGPWDTNKGTYDISSQSFTFTPNGGSFKTSGDYKIVEYTYQANRFSNGTFRCVYADRGTTTDPNLDFPDPRPILNATSAQLRRCPRQGYSLNIRVTVTNEQPIHAISNNFVGCDEVKGWMIDPDRQDIKLRYELFMYADRNSGGTLISLSNQVAQNNLPVIPSTVGGTWLNNNQRSGHGFSNKFGVGTSYNDPIRTGEARQFFLYIYGVDAQGQEDSGSVVKKVAFNMNCPPPTFVNIPSSSIIVTAETTTTPKKPTFVAATFRVDTDLLGGATQFNGATVYKYIRRYNANGTLNTSYVFPNQIVNPPPFTQSAIWSETVIFQIPTPSGLAINDTICAQTAVTPSVGKVTLAGDLIPPAGTLISYSSNDCITVGDTIERQPYTRIYGGDVYAGTDDACDNTIWGKSTTASPGSIYSNNTTTNGIDHGNGVQLGIFAQGKIGNPGGVFPSGMLRNGTPDVPLVLSTNPLGTGLNFSNNKNASNQGSFGGPHCMKDFTDEAYGNTVGTIDWTKSGTYTVYGPLLITSPKVIANGVHITIYVIPNPNLPSNAASDVLIQAPITYANAKGAAPWTNSTNIPSLKLISIGGDMLVTQTVTEIDGTYITQPRLDPIDNKIRRGGVFGSCSPIDATVSPTRVVAATEAMSLWCSRQLVINGSVVARSVRLGRTFGDIKNSTGFNERLNAGNLVCSTYATEPPVVAPAGWHANQKTCASELFVYSPEIYMAQGDADYSYDYLTSLPPVL